MSASLHNNARIAKLVLTTLKQWSRCAMQRPGRQRDPNGSNGAQERGHDIGTAT